MSRGFLPCADKRGAKALYSLRPSRRAAATGCGADDSRGTAAASAKDVPIGRRRPAAWGRPFTRKCPAALVVDGRRWYAAMLRYIGALRQRWTSRALRWLRIVSFALNAHQSSHAPFGYRRRLPSFAATFDAVAIAKAMSLRKSRAIYSIELRRCHYDR